MSLAERLQQLAQTIGADIKSIFTSLYALLSRIEFLESRLETGLLTPSGPVQNPKMFATTVNGVNGTWSVDYSSAGFTSIIGVYVTPIAVGTDAANRRIADVAYNSITTTGCSGNLMSATSAGLLAAMTLVSSSGEVQVLVIGT